MSAIPDFPVLRSAANFRDLGDLPAGDGRAVRRGVLFRSELLRALPEGDLETLGALGIASVYDLRNPVECVAAPSVWQQSGPSVALFAMPEELPLVGADFKQLVRRIGEASFDAGEAGDLMRATYRAMPGQFGPVLHRLFKGLASGQGACLVHCTAGKDRTGFVCAMLLLALDVPMDSILQDYLASARFFTVDRLTAHMETLLGHPLAPQMADALAPMAQVRAAYLETALAEIRRTWGSVSTYLQEQAGLDDALRLQLQARLLQAG